MTSLVDALRKKYEKLTECHIFETFVQKSPHRVGANILFPARSLSMDCQHIVKIGNEEELFRTAGHVAELDLAGNKLSSWIEVFTLLRCLRNLESLNLSQNPLGPDDLLRQTVRCINPERYDIPTGENDENKEQLVETEAMDITFNNRVAGSPNGSPILRFACNELFEEDSGNASFSNSTEHTQDSHTSVVYEVYNSFNGSVNDADQTTKVHIPPVRLAIDSGVIGPTTVFPKLTVLALNSTFIPWNWVLELIQLFPNLTTLHVALNNYGANEDSLQGAGDSFDLSNQPLTFHGLRTLYYSDNNISSWWTVCRLGRQFPCLEHLVLLGNPIEHIPAPLPAPNTSSHSRVTKLSDIGSSTVGPEKSHPRLFGNVHTLGLSETLINRWESIDALGEWMPKLKNLRLGNTLPVFQSWPEPDCRAHVIARLPNLASYNRSSVDSEERETAEREFVRYYGQVDPKLRPNRYWELERRHGRLEPLADIDLSPKRFIRVRVVCDGKETVHELNVNLKVSQAKRQFLLLFDIDPSESKRYKLFYCDQCMMAHVGPEELKYPNRAIHAYQPEQGDLFELVRVPQTRRVQRSN